MRLVNEKPRKGKWEWNDRKLRHRYRADFAMTQTQAVKLTMLCAATGLSQSQLLRLLIDRVELVNVRVEDYGAFRLLAPVDTEKASDAKR